MQMRMAPDGVARQSRSMTTEPRAIPPIAAAELAERLREATPQIIAALGGRLPRGRLNWRFETRDDIVKEWNGAEIGPSTHASWTWKTKGAEATVRLDTIRWSPSDVHRTEVTALWEVASRRAALFARAEGEGAITETRADAAIQKLLKP